MAAAEPVDPVPVAATDPLYVLYTSGTTGKPKGIVRDNGGHAVALLWSMRHIYDIAPGEVFWAASDVGLGGRPLLHRLRRRCWLGATTVLYEGKPVGTPDPGAFWRVAAEHRVKALFTAPTAIRAIRKEDPDGDATWPSTTCPRCSISSWPANGWIPTRTTGRRRSSASRSIDHWWQTETGWAIAANPMGVRAAADQGRFADACRCRATTCASCTPTATACEPGEEGVDLHAAAAAAGYVADAVGRRRPLRGVLPVRAPRLLPHRRRRLPRRGRVPVRDGPHRRRHQRCRAPACRPARSRRCWPRIPRWPSAP